MGRKKKEAATNGPAEPDFAGAAALIRSEISPDKEDLAKVQGDLSASWKRVEDQFHVNKKAAKDAARIANMSEETKQDYLRSLYGMFGAFGIALRVDLVDQAEGKEAGAFPTAGGAAGDSALLN